MHRVYLAGPDVFLPDAEAAGARLKAVCLRHGLEGVYPLDAGIRRREREPAALYARRLSEGAVLLLHGCHGMLANVTPFRGPSADVGTVWDMAYAHACRKPIVAYSDDAREYKERVVPDGLLVEDYGLGDSPKLVFSVLGTVRSIEAAAAKLAAHLSGGP